LTAHTPFAMHTNQTFPYQEMLELLLVSLWSLSMLICHHFFLIKMREKNQVVVFLYIYIKNRVPCQHRRTLERVLAFLFPYLSKQKEDS
jgi:hypothetical protein